jgi:CubicO group peptidase (beta-lactamase class C family)
MAPCSCRRAVTSFFGLISFVAISTLMVMCGSTLGAQPTAAPKPATQKTPWAPPIETGTLSAAQTKALDGAADYSAKFEGKAVLVMHNASVVYERYDNGGGVSTPNPLASGTKSFTGIGAMFAVQDGLFQLDDKVSATITEWAGDDLKKQITVRQLLTLSSGLRPDSSPQGRGGRGGARGGDAPVLPGVPSTPGTRAMMATRADWFGNAIGESMTGKPGKQFAYGGNHFYAFGAFLEATLKTSEIPQKKVWDYYTARLFDPIGMKIARIGRDQKGQPNLPGGAQLVAREWAKLGQFVLWNGAWKQPDGSMKQLLKPELLSQCFEPSANNPSYGLTWWLLKSGDTTSSVADNGGREGLAERMRRRGLDQQTKTVLGPDGKPVTVLMAAGLGKQRLFVLPQYQLVIVRFAPIDAEGAQFDNAAFLKPIVEAFNAEAAGAANPAVPTPATPVPPKQP